MNILTILESVRSRVQKRREKEQNKIPISYVAHGVNGEDINKERHDKNKRIKLANQRIAKHAARIKSHLAKNSSAGGNNGNSASYNTMAKLDGSKKIFVDSSYNKLDDNSKNQLISHEIEHVKQADEAYKQQGTKGLAKLKERYSKANTPNDGQNMLKSIDKTNKHAEKLADKIRNNDSKGVKKYREIVKDSAKKQNISTSKYFSDPLERSANELSTGVTIRTDKKEANKTMSKSYPSKITVKEIKDVKKERAKRISDALKSQAKYNKDKEQAHKHAQGYLSQINKYDGTFAHKIANNKIKINRE